MIYLSEAVELPVSDYSSWTDNLSLVLIWSMTPGRGLLNTFFIASSLLQHICCSVSVVILNFDLQLIIPILSLIILDTTKTECNSCGDNYNDVNDVIQ